MTDSLPKKQLLLTPASQIKTRRQKWFWEPFQGQGVIPLGTATIVAGKGGEGKTTFMLDLAAKGSRGELAGDLSGKKISTIIIGPEDDWETAMVPRLVGAGADLDRIYQIEVKAETNELTMTRSIKFPLDVDMITEAIRETGAKMIIVDPAPSLMHGDMNKAQDVRSSYEPLIAVAQREELALVLINHFGKGGGSVSSKLSGSHAWRDLTRSYLAFATDEETGERIFSQDKGNYTKGLNSYKFSLESVDVQTDDGDTANVAKVNFMGLTTQTVDEIINRESMDESGGSDCDEWLMKFLDRVPYEFLAADLMKAAQKEGFSPASVKRSKKKLSIQHSWTQESPSRTVWHHPEKNQPAQEVSTPDPSDLGELGELGADSRGFYGELGKENNNISPLPVHLAQVAQVAHPDQHGQPSEPRRKACPLHGHDDDHDCFTCEEIRTELAS